MDVVVDNEDSACIVVMVIPVECHKTSSCRLKERWCLHFVAVDHLIVRMGRKTTANRAMFCAHRGVNVYGEVT